MKKIIYLLSFMLLFAYAKAQEIELYKTWKYKSFKDSVWRPAVVPGSIYQSLLKNKQIPDPFFGMNEKKVQWVDSTDWEFKNSFVINKKFLSKDRITLTLKGIDTYSAVYLNDSLIGTTSNMHVAYEYNLKNILKPGTNTLHIKIFNAIHKSDSLAMLTPYPLQLPGAAIRKSSYQFGWDWGITLVGAGIWQPVVLNAESGFVLPRIIKDPALKLVQEKDSIGRSFYFVYTGKDEHDADSLIGKPVFIKGANWIPLSAYPGSGKEKDYEQLIAKAKAAGINMLRVWGGGHYESDDFYATCEYADIYIWQDFMFANTMYPGSPTFFAEVKKEVQYQVKRLMKYSNVVLYCGNNEIEEAWNHWGWQNQYNLHGKDSALVWDNYKRLFKDSIPAWIKEIDETRPYISTSPTYGWGNPLSYKNGDSHYWGLWWGLQDWENWFTHTGRFVSEYGMQAMPDWFTVQSYTDADQRFLESPQINHHQKASEGFKKLNHYINRYFFDTTQLKKLSLQEYTYLSNCMQYYILKNSIAVHLQKQPYCMGTMVWQLNDSWPVTSWSLIDYSGIPKGGYYAVQKAYTTEDTITDKTKPKDLKLQLPNITISKGKGDTLYVHSDRDAKYIYLYGYNSKYIFNKNYFDLAAGDSTAVYITNQTLTPVIQSNIKYFTLYDILKK